MPFIDHKIIIKHKLVQKKDSIDLYLLLFNDTLKIKRTTDEQQKSSTIDS